MPRKRRTASTPPAQTQSPSDGASDTDSTLPPGTPLQVPFFTLAIEGPNTAVALDASGNEIISLTFEDFNDLISDNFLEYATAAVATVFDSRSSGGGGDGGYDNDSNTVEKLEFINLVDSENEIDIEGDLNKTFAAVLAEHIAEDALAAARAAEESLDADFALALRLQEEEEHEKEEEERRAAAIKTGGGVWGNINNKFSAPTPLQMPPLSHSFSDTMGTAPGISTTISTHVSSKNKYKPSEVEFPSLLSPPPPLVKQPANHIVVRKNDTIAEISTAAERGSRVRRMHVGNASNLKTEEELAAVDNIDANSHSQQKQKQKQHVSVMNDADDLSTIEFLDSYDGEAVQARATALRFAQNAAAKEEQREINNRNTGQAAAAAGAGASREAIKKMMDRAHTSSTTRSQQVEVEENADENGGFGYNRKKKIRTLVLSMIDAGWQFMPERRGSGHYIYQRFIPPTGHKQIIVLPCTPSSQRSIDAVHARLQKLDIEAMAVRAAEAGMESDH